MYQEYEKIHANEPLNIGHIGNLLKRYQLFKAWRSKEKQ